MLSMHKNKKIAFVVVQYFCNTEKLNRLKTKTHSKLLFISNETNKCNLNIFFAFLNEETVLMIRIIIFIVLTS